MYQKIVIEAINYIKENLEEELTVEKIANHCHYSKYYFNRLFKSEVGESVYEFIKRLRVEQSIIKIITDNETTITEASNMYGYSSSNYSTLFKKHYNTTPKKFIQYFKESSVKERQGHYVDLSDKNFDYYNSSMKKVNLDDINVLYKRFIGDYRKIHQFWISFLDEYGDYFDESSIRLEVSYDDPIVTDPNRCITDLCITTWI